MALHTLQQTQCIAAMRMMKGQTTTSFGSICSGNPSHICMDCNDILSENSGEFTVYRPFGWNIYLESLAWNALKLHDLTYEGTLQRFEQQGYRRNDVKLLSALLKVAGKELLKKTDPLTWSDIVSEALENYDNYDVTTPILLLSTMLDNPRVSTATQKMIVDQLKIYDRCVKCHESKAVVAFFPCHHLALCNPCFQEIRDHPSVTCTVCSKSVKESRYISPAHI